MLANSHAIMQLSLHHDFIIQAKHLPGKSNILADTLSHSQLDPAFLHHHGLQLAPMAFLLDLISLIAHYEL